MQQVHQEAAMKQRIRAIITPAIRVLGRALRLPVSLAAIVANGAWTALVDVFVIILSVVFGVLLQVVWLLTMVLGGAWVALCAAFANDPDRLFGWRPVKDWWPRTIVWRWLRRVVISPGRTWEAWTGWAKWWWSPTPSVSTAVTSPDPA